MTAETEADMIRRASSRWLKANESYVRSLVDTFPDLTVDELKAQTGWSDAQVNNMLTYLSMVGDDQ